MSATDASRLLRPGLLDGVCILLAPGASAAGHERPGASAAVQEPRMGEAVHRACAALGARISSFAPAPGESPEQEEAATEEGVAAALAELGRIDMLVVDGAALLARESPPQGVAGEARESSAERAGALGACLQEAWMLTRSVFNLAYLPGAGGGRIVYLAPAPAGEGSQLGEHAAAARAGLENLSRTLSIEWARHGVTALTIAPGASTSAGEVAALAAYLASAAGSYFSGCLLELGGAP